MYYIAEDNMPFAINISNSEFRWPSEKVSITTYYPSLNSGEILLARIIKIGIYILKNNKG